MTEQTKSYNVGNVSHVGFRQQELIIDGESEPYNVIPTKAAEVDGPPVAGQADKPESTNKS
jgi:hypothetical protein